MIIEPKFQDPPAEILERCRNIWVERAPLYKTNLSMRRVSLHTLGCKLNFAETSTIARDFKRNGFEVVPFGQPAEVSVINTCTVTSQADQKCRSTIRRARRANPDAFVIVTGCYAQLSSEVIAKIEGVDMVLGSNEKFKIFSLIDSFTRPEKTQIEVSCLDDMKDFGPAYSAGDRTRAFLKVQDGCDYTCSFCTIPQARGKSRSQSVEAIVNQAKEIAAKGYKEIVLSGVNIGLFGQDCGTNLLALVKALDEVEGIERYRISSIEPNLLTDEILTFVATAKRFKPHFHIPLQSGDDEVLAKMRRRYKRQLYADRVAKIKSLMPDACIGVDVIVGFPAEKDENFDNTMKFLTDLPISYLHVFTYSERPNTSAVDQIEKMGGLPISKHIRSERNKRLRILSTKKLQAFYQQHLGEERAVLWEAANRNGMMQGFTDNYIKVQRPFDEGLIGDITQSRLKELSSVGTVLCEDQTFIPI